MVTTPLTVEAQRGEVRVTVGGVVSGGGRTVTVTLDEALWPAGSKAVARMVWTPGVTLSPNPHAVLNGASLSCPTNTSST